MNKTDFAPKPRFEILDGLRGVAALVVLAYHQFEMYAAGPHDACLNHGYLAVDFFFILSGYVLGYAYDDRWGKMGYVDFFKRRLKRLHPLIIFAIVLCALMFYVDNGGFFPKTATTPVWRLALMSVLGILMIPTGASLDIRGWNEFYPVHGNAWTLFFEYIANIFYALIIRRLPKIALGMAIAGFAFLTLNLTLNWDVFGVLEGCGHPYTVVGGWELSKGHMLIGFTRLLYPFFMGLLLSRLRKTIKVPGGFWTAAILLFALLAMPHFGGAENWLPNGIYEAVAILVGFPLIVLMGAGSQAAGVTQKMAKWLGDISYPVYILQYSFEVIAKPRR